MSVRSMQPAERSNVPVYSIEEAKKKGLNVARVPTCAIPMIGPNNVYIIRGCPKGKHCAVSGFGTARMGAFGPRDTEDGSSGSGAENVPFYHYDVGSSTEVEGFMPCAIWMQTMMDKYESQRKTGDVLEILGREGETSITILETLPSDGNGNKPGSSTHMVETPKTITVPKFKANDGKSSRMEYALKMREARDRIEAASNRTRMAPVPKQDEVVAREPEVEEAEELPDLTVETGDGDEVATEGVLGDLSAVVIPPSGRRTNGPSRNRG